MSENNFQGKNDKKLNVFNNAVEYFDRFNNNNLLFEQKENLTKDGQTINPNFLRDQMLIELNKLKELILSNPNFKLKNLSEAEKQRFFEFVNHYAICPICGNKNHYNVLKELYFDDTKQFLKEQLILFMNLKNQNVKKLNLSFGIPCCNCFKLHFKKKNEQENHSSDSILF